ncbi:MAG: hypothetical protein C5B58_00200 [Acidobacteria bacterium]|nr:MAG: hypothetical protein C5B58_00200 [Acidobacteriota bacterium]
MPVQPLPEQPAESSPRTRRDRPVNLRRNPQCQVFIKNNMNTRYLTNWNTFAFCIGLCFLDLHQAAAQTAGQTQHPQADREHPAEAWRPAATPAPPVPPGLFPSATPQPSASATLKARPTIATLNQSAKQPAQAQPARMKLVAIYHGAGFFDAGLAEKLRPELAKAFGITPVNNSKAENSRSAPLDMLRSAFGQNQGPEKNTGQNGITNAAQP